MKKQAKKVLILTLGVIFVVLGLLGLVLPFLQGILFLAIGFFLLSFYFPKVRLTIRKRTERYPHLHKALDKMEVWISKIVGEV